MHQILHIVQLVLARATDCVGHEKLTALSGYFTEKKSGFN